VSAWSDTRLVASREVDEKLHSRTFVLSTLFFLLIVGLSIALPALLFDGGPQDYDVAVAGADARALVEAVPDDAVELTAVPGDTVDVDQLLRDGDVDAGLTVAVDGSLQISAAESVPADLREALTTTAQLAAVDGALREAGTPAADVERLLRPVPVQERLLEEQSSAPEAAPLLSLAFILLFFFVVFQFGYAIAQGVVQEKESRVVELLVSAVPVRTLLFGKVLGNGALALTQIVLLVAVAVVGAAALGERELLSLLVRSSGWFVLFFVLGFAMLSCLWAAAGAFASRTEDLQSTTVPLQVLVVGPLFAAVYVPPGTLRTVLSFVPMSSPTMMPARLVEGDAGVWEAAVAAVLLLLAALLAIRVGERLYRASLLRTRGRTSVRQAWTGQEADAARR
jgi:ABC-2 type transport system permease protein